MFADLDIVLRLHKIPLFAVLPVEVLVPLAGLVEQRYLELGEVLFRQGEFGDALYVVAEGALRVEQGDRHVADVAAGACVGEMAVIDWEPRSATVVATETSLLFRLDRNDVMDLLIEHPKLLKALMGVLVARLRDSQ
jgi:CRP/FNR family cyclic AMP-dependent transcriptional regulator